MPSDAETEAQYGWMLEELGFVPLEAGYVHVCLDPVEEPVVTEPFVVTP